MIDSWCVLVTQDVDVPGYGTVAGGTYFAPSDAVLQSVPKKLQFDQCSVHPIVSVIFYVAFFVLCALVLVNLIVAAILENMGRGAEDEMLPVSKSSLDDFKRAWAELDPMATGAS